MPSWLFQAEKHPARMYLLSIMFAPPIGWWPYSLFHLPLPPKGQGRVIVTFNFFSSPWNLEQCLEQTHSFAISIYWLYILKKERNSRSFSFSSHVIKSHCWIFQHILHPPVFLFRFSCCQTEECLCPCHQAPRLPFARLLQWQWKRIQR